MLRENKYIEDQLANTVRDVFQEHFKHKFILVSLKTGINSSYKDIDVFEYFNSDTLDKILNQNYYLIIELKDEGYSNDIHNIFEMIYYNCEKYKKNVKEVIYISSNLRDTDVLNTFCNTHSLEAFHIIPLLFFETVDVDQTQYLIHFKSFNNSLKRSIKKSKNFYIDKMFSSLSRQNRADRSYLTFLLCQHEISKYGLISHSAMDNHTYDEIELLYLQPEDKKHFDEWCSKLPLVADRTDFDNNWALPQFDFYNIHDSTIFQIVNETYRNNWNNTSLFYSEKTFRPILALQPFVINGQQGCNKYLAKLGYKTYDDWFDLSFDDEPDTVSRYKKLLLSVEDAVKYLKSLNRDQQIEWRFKNKETMKHNLKVMLERTNCEKVLIDYIKKLNKL